MLCFALDLADQERTALRYSYSLFQAEYSRNLLFTSGRRMDRIFGALIDRVRGPLDLRTVNTLFGRRQRHKGQPRALVVEVSLETPEYDLTILRIRFRAPGAEDLHERRAGAPYQGPWRTMRGISSEGRFPAICRLLRGSRPIVPFVRGCSGGRAIGSSTG